MDTIRRHAAARTIASGESDSWTITDGLPCSATLLAKVAGDSGFGAVFTVDVSPDDGDTWYALKVVDLTGSSEDALAASVTFGTAGARAVAGIDYTLPLCQVRVTVAVTTHPITLEMWLIG